MIKEYKARKTVKTILIVYNIHTAIYIQAGSVDKRSPPPPAPSSGVVGGKVRSLVSLAVTTGIAGTGSVEAVKERSSRGMQKSHRRVG